MTGRTYFTTPIYYVNDRPHIGHAYCTVLADAYSRFFRLFGHETFFLTGTDEHGQKVEKAAAERGVTPEQHVDELHVAFKSLWPELHIEPNDFIRTTEPRHEAVVRRALQEIYDRGEIYLGSYVGWYSVRAERFWTEKDLVKGRCPDTGGPVERVEEQNYFFKMSAYQDRLIAHLEANRDWIVPASRWQEIRSFLDRPLQDLSISRPKSRLKWGITLPFDEDYVTYVWFDALLNYCTAVGLYSDETRFEQWWQGAHHFIGKDILTTHAVYWPTMLMALGLPLPARICATGWWLIDNTKMSKSLGNVVAPLSLRERYGTDVLRYFLMRDMVLGLDASFSEEALVRRNNSDLANDLGNLLRRALTLVSRHFDGRVPAQGPEGPEDSELKAQLSALPSLVEEKVRGYRLHDAIEEILQAVRAMNRYIDHTAPFKVIKSDPPRAGEILRNVLQGLRLVALLLRPIMPERMTELLGRVGVDDPSAEPRPPRFGDLPSGRPVSEGDPLFPRREFVPPEPEPAKPEQKPAPAPAPKKKTEEAPAEPEIIEFADFVRLNLVVAKVLTAVAVPKSKKLLKLTVDAGDPEPRTLMAGAAEAYSPEDLLGRSVVMLKNLRPRKIFGIESQGMVLMAEDGDRLVLLEPAADVPPGTPIH